MIIFDADDPLVLNGTYDREGYKPGERARIAKARARQEALARTATSEPDASTPCGPSRSQGEAGEDTA